MEEGRAEEKEEGEKTWENIYLPVCRNYSCLHRRNGVKHIRSPSNLWKKYILEIVISDDIDSTMLYI